MKVLRLFCLVATGSALWLLTLIAPLAAQPAGRSGTGFAVGPTSVLTNAHVVADCSDVELTSVSGEEFIAKVVARDSRNDLALLAFETPRRPYAVFRRTSMRSGEDVVALGFPYRGLLAADVNVSVGIVSAMAGLLNDTSQMQISAPVQPGNSGGPLLDETGAVAGVVVAKLDAVTVARVIGDIPQNINFAIKGEVAQLFLRSHGIEPRQILEPKRTSVADRVQAARPYTYLISCKAAEQAAVREQERAAARLEEERHAAERQAEVVRREAERRAKLEISNSVHCTMSPNTSSVCSYRSLAECEAALRSAPLGSYCVPWSSAR